MIQHFPQHVNGANEYKFDTPSTLLSAIKFEDSSDSDSVDSEYELFAEDSAFTAALLNEASLNNAGDQELDDIKHIRTEKPWTYKGDDVVVKEEPEINEIVIKDELVSSPVVLQPWTIPHTQPSNEGDDFIIKEETEINEFAIKDELDISPVVLQRKTTPHLQPATEAQAPGRSVDGDATPAPSDALYVQSPPKSKVEDLRYEDDRKGLDITNSYLRVETNEANKADENEERYIPSHYERGSREMHIRTVGKPYKCKQCGYRGSQPSHMERHMSIHVSAKPYKCKHCEYTAFLPDSLQRHINCKHVSRKSYQCKQCDHKTGRRGRPQKHIYTHTGEKPYQCIQCEYRASAQCTLRVGTHAQTYRRKTISV